MKKYINPICAKQGHDYYSIRNPELGMTGGGYEPSFKIICRRCNN